MEPTKVGELTTDMAEWNYRQCSKITRIEGTTDRLCRADLGDRNNRDRLDLQPA